MGQRCTDHMKGLVGETQRIGLRRGVQDSQTTVGYNRLTNSILRSEGSESSMCVRAYETGAC